LKRTLGYRVPAALLLVLGLFMAIQYYVPHPIVQRPKELILQWKQPINAYIIFLALGGLVAMHLRRIAKRKERWGYSVITLASAAAMTFVGLAYGVQDDTVFADWFAYLVTPIEATMFSLLAFFVASAAFRAFRARTVGATILLVSAAIVMLGMIPTVQDAIPWLGDAAEFLLKYPNTAAKRAIMIGVALGAISVSLKAILGIDKTILTKGE
jgi:hypothetical protein